VILCVTRLHQVSDGQQRRNLGPRNACAFGSLDVIITIDGRLERIQTPTHSGGASTVANTLQGLHLRRREQGVPAAPPRCSFNSVRLERQLQAFRGPHTTQDDLRCTIYSLANVAAQLAGGNPISPSVMAGYATTAFPLGMGNAARHTHHNMVQHATAHPGDDELVGMVELVSESDDDPSRWIPHWSPIRIPAAGVTIQRTSVSWRKPPGAA